MLYIYRVTHFEGVQKGSKMVKKGGRGGRGGSTFLGGVQSRGTTMVDFELFPAFEGGQKWGGLYPGYQGYSVYIYIVV